MAPQSVRLWDAAVLRANSDGERFARNSLILRRGTLARAFAQKNA
jgi:hypothetical protein